MSSYEYRREIRSGPEGYDREFRSGNEALHREFRTLGGNTAVDEAFRPPTNQSNYSSHHSTSHHQSSVSPTSIPPLPKSEYTEEYSYTTKTGPAGSYTITKGPYIRVEHNHQGPDYRAHLGPRPALGGRKQYTTTTTVTRGNIGGRPVLH